MRRLLFLIVGLVTVAGSVQAAEPFRPAERWRGFNLMEMFQWDAELPKPIYRESDFKFMKENGFNFVRLIVLSFATSIDALLIGVGYACLKRESILADVLIIGFVTFLISGAGCIAGRRGGRLIGNRCEALGGLVLIGIGVKVLLLD